MNVKSFTLTAFSVIFGGYLHAQDSLHLPKIWNLLKRIDFEAFGAANFYAYDWESFPGKRNDIDLERFVLEGKFNWDKHWSFGTELEIEHGGTGITMEFDRFEEFGEFELEIEKGGEVLLERMYMQYNHNDAVQVQIGRIQVPLSLQFTREEPTDYLTTNPAETSLNLIPTNWTDNGISLFGRMGREKQWYYNLSLINGLDCSAFSSATFIKRGNQKRFEFANANNFSLTGRLDYHFHLGNMEDEHEEEGEDHESFADIESDEDNYVGAAFYYGRSDGNRPKPDMSVPVYVGVYNAYVVLNPYPFRFAAEVIYGTVSNSEILSNTNRNLSNNLNVKRTPVGSSALGTFGELGFDIFSLFKKYHRQHPQKRFEAFVRYDWYDTMFTTEGLIFNNPRWARRTATVGINFRPIEQIRFKAMYGMRTLGAGYPNAGDDNENTFSAGFAFEF